MIRRVVCVPGDAVFQHHPIQILHGDERLPVLVVNFVDCADVRMIQSGCRLRLALEAGQSLWIFGYLVRQKLQRDKSV